MNKQGFSNPFNPKNFNPPDMMKNSRLKIEEKDGVATITIAAMIAGLDPLMVVQVSCREPLKVAAAIAPIAYRCVLGDLN